MVWRPTLRHLIVRFILCLTEHKNQIKSYTRQVWIDTRYFVMMKIYLASVCKMSIALKFVVVIAIKTAQISCDENSFLYVSFWIFKDIFKKSNLTTWIFIGLLLWLPLMHLLLIQLYWSGYVNCLLLLIPHHGFPTLTFILISLRPRFTHIPAQTQSVWHSALKQALKYSLLLCKFVPPWSGFHYFIWALAWQGSESFWQALSEASST